MNRFLRMSKLKGRFHEVIMAQLGLMTSVRDAKSEFGKLTQAL